VPGRLGIAGSVLALGLAACGGGGAGDRADTSPPARAAPADDGGAIRSAEHDARDAEGPPATTPSGRVVPPEPQDTEPDKGTPGAQDATGGKIDVPIRQGRFTPAVMRLKAGQIVVFTNDDDVPHAVWADEGALPHSGAIPVGGRFEFTPLKPGRIAYRDPLHPGTTGVLVVAPEHPACSKVSSTARHEAGDLAGDMARDTGCDRDR
jgi:plastocyanin